MSASLETLAREKEILVMRSALCRLRLRLAKQRARGAPAVRLARRIASVVRIAYAVSGAVRDRAVSNRRREAIALLSTHQQRSQSK